MNRIEPYLQIGNIDLYLQDCISGFKKLEKESVDVVVTSPPYNIGVGYNKYKDKIPTEKYLDWMEDLSIQIKRVLKTDGSFFINIGNKPTDPLLPLRVAFQIEKHFKLQNVIHWIKSIAITKSDTTNISHDIAVGHFKPVVSNRFLSDCHEYIFHFTIKGDVKLNKLAVGVPYQDKSNIGRWKAATQDKRDRGNTWFIPYKTIRKFEDRPHPSTFPILLPEMCIKLHDHVERVIDPFVGIGSSALACMKLGVSFAGFDIDKTYLDITYKRLLQFRI